eukprot:607518-Amphidinium_carterae.1
MSLATPTSLTLLDTRVRSHTNIPYTTGYQSSQQRASTDTASVMTAKRQNNCVREEAGIGQRLLSEKGYL